MTSLPIDTLKAAHKLQASGFTKKQAEGAAELLADALVERAGKDATATALSLVSAKLETMDQRQQTDAAELRRGLAAVKEGLAVVNENQLETNRALTAIMAHLGIPKSAG